MMYGARHMKNSTNSSLMRGGMRRNGIYQIGPPRERLRRFFALRSVLTGPKLRRGRLEFHSRLVKSGGLFVS